MSRKKRDQTDPNHRIWRAMTTGEQRMLQAMRDCRLMYRGRFRGKACYRAATTGQTFGLEIAKRLMRKRLVHENTSGQSMPLILTPLGAQVADEHR